MNLSEIRYVFWDGSVNVNKDNGDVDSAISCKHYYLEPVPVPTVNIKPKPASVAHRFGEGLTRGGNVNVLSTKEERTILSNLVIPTIKVRIVAVDRWIVPVTDLMAIKLKLRLIPRIMSMLIRIRACKKDGVGPIIFQEILKGDEIKRLPNEPPKDGPDLKGNLSWKETLDTKNRRIKAREKIEIARCLTHCTVKVWISADEKAFDDWTANDDPFEEAAYAQENPLFPIHDQTLPPDSPWQLWRSLQEAGWTPQWIKNARSAWERRITHKQDKHDDRAGKNQSLIGCSLIEEIMADRTNIHVMDSEPKDKLWSDKSLGNLVASDGLAFPEFKALIRRTLYDVCRHSPLGMALLENVAKNGPRQVHLFPAKHFYPHVGGAGVNPAVGFPDDFAYMRRVKELIRLITKSQRSEIRDSRDPDVVALRSDPMISAYLADDKLKVPPEFAVTFAVKRLLLKKIGASDPALGCDSRFYFNLGYISDNFHKREYQCRFHRDDSTTTVKVGGEDRQVVIASMGEESVDVPVHIETPLFLAFLHEMVHARRFQTGTNAEYDEFPKSAPSALAEPTFHKESMISAMHPKKQAPTDLVKNFLDRYKEFNREEFDTIEGLGAQIEITPKQTAYVKSKQLGDSSKIVVNENVFRKELGLPMRRRYVDDKTTKKFTMGGDEVAKAKKRIYIKAGSCETNPEKPPETPFVLEEYLKKSQQKTNELFASLGAGSKQVPLMVRDQSYMLKDAAHFITGYQFGTILKSAKDKESMEWCPALIQDLNGQLAGLPAGVKDAVKQIVESADIDRLKALKILQKIFELSEGDLMKVIDLSPNLKVVYEKARQYDAFAGFRMDLSGKSVDDSWGRTVDPSTVLQDSLAAYLPVGYRQKDPHNVLHTLIHEPMHLLSFWCSGFDQWDLNSGSSSVQTYDVVVEGLNAEPNKLKDLIANQKQPARYLQESADVPNWLEHGPAKESISVAERSKISAFGNTSKIETSITILDGEGGLGATTDKANKAKTDIANLCRDFKDVVAFKDVQQPIADKLKGALDDTGAATAVKLVENKLRGKFFFDQLLDLPNPDAIKTVFNEGTTELFARIVSYRVNRDANSRAVRISTFAGFHSYEYPHHLVCQLVRDLDAFGGNGLKTLASAFFFGDWKQFNDRLLDLGKQNLNGRYTGAYWSAVANLGISNDQQRDVASCSNAVKSLRDQFGIGFVMPGDLVQSIQSDTYHDPLCCRHEYLPGPMDSYIFHPEPIADGALGQCCNPVRSPSPAPKDPEPLPTVCPQCEEKIEIPGKEFLKTVV